MFYVHFMCFMLKDKSVQNATEHVGRGYNRYACTLSIFCHWILIVINLIKCKNKNHLSMMLPNEN